MNEERNIPKGWEIKKLIDIAEIVRGVSYKGSDSEKEPREGYNPILRAGNINSSITYDDLTYVPEKYINKDQYLKPFDVLIATSSGSKNIVGKSAQINEERRIAFGAFCCVARPHSIEPKFLNFYFQSKIYKHFVKRTLRGANINNLRISEIRNLDIQIPPLSTQKKIVAILEKADKLKGWRREADELTDEFLKNTFLEIFGDPVTNQNGFKSGTIADLVIKTQYGTSKKANEIGEGMPIVRMNNITYEGKWDFSSLKYIEFDENDKEKYLVNNGELLFNRTNSKELVGKSAVYKEKEPMAFAGYLIKIITDSPATSDFIAGHLNSEFGKLYLLKMAKSIVGMANINAQEVQKIPILIPPMELREKYAIIVEQIELLRGFQKQSNMEINDLYNSLLQKAFKGELVN